jgi:hypothetical protein
MHATAGGRAQVDEANVEQREALMARAATREHLGVGAHEPWRAVAARALARAEKVVLHDHLEAPEERAAQDGVRVLGKVHVRVGAQHAVVEGHRHGDVAPLLRPHEEHVARLEVPRGQPGVVVPERRPRARPLAVLGLEPLAQRLSGEDEVVADAQPLRGGEQGD